MSLFSEVEGFFKKFFSKAPSTTVVSLAVVNTIAPLAETVIALVDPALETVAAPIITEIQADLAVLSNTLKNGSTSNVTTLVSAIQTNLSALLTAGHIKDPASVAKATGLVNLIKSELSVIAPSA